MTDDRIDVIYDEKEVLAKALFEMQDNDLVFVLADEVPAVLEQIRELAAEQAH